ncbi:MAG: hypothetical protein V3V61_00210 [Gammaproteobacteria bacterium]
MDEKKDDITPRDINALLTGFVKGLCAEFNIKQYDGPERAWVCEPKNKYDSVGWSEDERPTKVEGLNPMVFCTPIQAFEAYRLALRSYLMFQDAQTTAGAIIWRERPEIQAEIAEGVTHYYVTSRLWYG